MPYSTDPHPGQSISPPSTSSSQQQYGFVCMSTVDDLSYTPSEQEKSRDDAQMAATGRRSWKTLKGKGEAVWPPVLEAALIEALERYQPDSGSRSHKILGRFPMRNRFISDYIYELTEKRRTPKQVGSRLQQLRDTCKDPRILQLISRRGSDQESVGTPSPPPGNGSRLVVYTDITIEGSYSPSHPPTIEVKPNDVSSPLTVHLSPISSPENHQDGSLNVLRHFSRIVRLLSPLELVTQSTFVVYRGQEAIHQEVVPLQPCSPLRGQWFYTSELSPNFWNRLCDSRDPTKYTLLQNMTPAHLVSDEPQQISVVYYFVYPEDTSEQQYSEPYNNSPQFSQHSVSSQESSTYASTNFTADTGQYYYRQDHSPNWEGYPPAAQVESTYYPPEPSVPRASANGTSEYPPHAFPSGTSFHSQPSVSWSSSQHPAPRYETDYYS